MELLKKAVEKIEKSIHGKHVMILIDTSGSMYEVIEVIKQAVKELIKLISMRINSKFNIISFSKLITSYSNKMESCTEENLNSAYSWISSLICENATNMLSGLVAAFSEQYCDSLVLFTDSLPYQRPSVVLKFVNELSQSRPINSIYINNGYVDPKVEEFLLSLSVSTNGSSHTLTQFNNALEHKQNFPPCKEITTYCYDSLSSCSETSDNEENEVSSDDEKVLNIGDGYNIVGMTVLAKRVHDGYFYKGIVIRSYPDVDEVLVSFLPSKKALQHESIGLSEILLYDNIKKLKAYVGDRVLVNFDSKKKYVPGTVRENKHESTDKLVSLNMLKVEMFDGNIKTIPMTSVFPINEEIYLECVNSILLSSSHSITKKVVLSTVKRHCRMTHGITRNRFLSDKHNKKILTREELSEKIEAQLKESKALLNSLNIYEEPVNYFHHHGTPCYDDYDSGFAGESLEDSKVAHVKFTPKPPQSKKLTVEEIESSDSNTSEDQQSSIRTRTYTNPQSNHHQLQLQTPSTWNNKHSLPQSQWKRKHSSSVGSNVVERSKKHWVGRPLNKDMSHLKARRFNKKPFADDYQSVDGTPMPRKTDFHVKKRENIIHYQESDIPYQHFQHHDIIGHRVVEYKPVYIKNPSPNQSSSSKCEVKTVQENLNVNKIYEKKEKIKRQNEGKNIKVNNSYEQREHTKRENEVKKQEENKKILHKHHKEIDTNAYNRIKIIIERDNEKANYKQKKVKDRIQMEYDREDSKQKQKFARINAMAEKRMNYSTANHGNIEEKSSQTEIPPSQKRLDFERQRVENQIQNHEAKIQRLKALRKYTDARVETLKRNNDKSRDINEYVKNQQLSNSRANILP